MAGTWPIAAPAASCEVDYFFTLKKPGASAACGVRLHCGLRWEEGTRRDQRAKTKTCPPKRVNSKSFFNVASDIERLDAAPSFGPPIIDSYGGRSLHEQSHGESFLALMLNRFGGRGLYVLDEPEAALSPTRQLAVLRRMRQLVEDESQFIVATHSPILMAYPGARIYLLDRTGFSKIRYEDTEHYAVTKEFLANPTRMLEQLFADDD